MSVPGGRKLSAGRSDGAGVGSSAGEASGETEVSGDADTPVNDGMDMDETDIPAVFRALPTHRDMVSTKAQTISNVIRRKRERICFIESGYPFGI